MSFNFGFSIYWFNICVSFAAHENEGHLLPSTDKALMIQ